MNTDGHLYSDNEIAGNMMEEYDKKDQQISVEVKIKFIFVNSFNNNLVNI